MAMTANPKRKHVMKGKPLGKEWKKVVEEDLDEGRCQARAGAIENWFADDGGLSSGPYPDNVLREVPAQR